MKGQAQLRVVATIFAQRFHYVPLLLIGVRPGPRFPRFPRRISGRCGCNQFVGCLPPEESAKRSSTSSLGVKKSVVFRCSPEDFAAAEDSLK